MRRIEMCVSRRISNAQQQQLSALATATNDSVRSEARCEKKKLRVETNGTMCQMNKNVFPLANVCGWWEKEFVWLGRARACVVCMYLSRTDNTNDSLNENRLRYTKDSTLVSIEYNNKLHRIDRPLLHARVCVCVALIWVHRRLREWRDSHSSNRHRIAFVLACDGYWAQPMRRRRCNCISFQFNGISNTFI